MPTGEVRDIEQRFNLWGGFRDEMIATAMTLSLVVLGTFVVTERVFFNPDTKKSIAVTPLPTSNPQTLGAQDPPAAATPALIEPTPDPTPDINLTQVAYGEDGSYDYDAYSIAFKSPVLEYDKQTKSRRKLHVSVTIKNKTISAGLPVRIVASVIKDGVIIVPEAVLYIANNHPVAMGETATFDASLPLIEATDARELKYKPGNDLPESSHFLFP